MNGLVGKILNTYISDLLARVTALESSNKELNKQLVEANQRYFPVSPPYDGTAFEKLRWLTVENKRLGEHSMQLEVINLDLQEELDCLNEQYIAAIGEQESCP